MLSFTLLLLPYSASMFIELISSSNVTVETSIILPSKYSSTFSLYPLEITSTPSSCILSCSSSVRLYGFTTSYFSIPQSCISDSYMGVTPIPCFPSHLSSPIFCSFASSIIFCFIASGSEVSRLKYSANLCVVCRSLVLPRGAAATSPLSSSSFTCS